MIGPDSYRWSEMVERIDRSELIGVQRCWPG